MRLNGQPCPASPLPRKEHESILRRGMDVCSEHNGRSSATRQCAGRPNRITWLRNDHLYTAGMRASATAGVRYGFKHDGNNRQLCDWRAALREHSLVVLGSPGAHLLDVARYNKRHGLEPPDNASQRARFREMAAYLAKLRSAGDGGARSGVGGGGGHGPDGASGAVAQAEFVWLRLPWGTEHPNREGAGEAPLAQPPSNVTHRWGWEQIPTLNDISAECMRERGIAVVDPTRALAMRQDCRSDFIHPRPEVHMHVTWRLLRHAISEQP